MTEEYRKNECDMGGVTEGNKSGWQMNLVSCNGDENGNSNGNESPKSGGKVGLHQKRRWSGRSDNDICAFRKISGWLRSLSVVLSTLSAVGGGGGEDAVVLFLMPPGTDTGGRTPSLAEAYVKRQVGTNDEELE